MSSLTHISKSMNSEKFENFSDEPVGPTTFNPFEKTYVNVWRATIRLKEPSEMLNFLENIFST